MATRINHRFGVSEYRSSCGIGFLNLRRGFYVADYQRTEYTLTKQNGRWLLDHKHDMGPHLVEAVEAAAAHIRA